MHCVLTLWCGLCFLADVSLPQVRIRSFVFGISIKIEGKFLPGAFLRACETARQDCSCRFVTLCIVVGLPVVFSLLLRKEAKATLWYSSGETRESESFLFDPNKHQKGMRETRASLLADMSCR